MVCPFPSLKLPALQPKPPTSLTCVNWVVLGHSMCLSHSSLPSLFYTIGRVILTCTFNQVNPYEKTCCWPPTAQLPKFLTTLHYLPPPTSQASFSLTGTTYSLFWSFWTFSLKLHVCFPPLGLPSVLPWVKNTVATSSTSLFFKSQDEDCFLKEDLPGHLLSP